MAKLYYRFGAMNSGKTTALLQAAHNYEERGHSVLLAKPALDTKGDTRIVSRLGVARESDLVIPPDMDLFGEVRNRRAMSQASDGDIHCLLIDEAQFLTAEQVDDCLRIAVLDDVPVLAYGIRTDFQTRAFPGSARLLEVAHSLEELKTICRCGRKAIFNARTHGGEFVFEGSQVAIDGDMVSYEALCVRCYLDESGGALS